MTVFFRASIGNRKNPLPPLFLFPSLSPFLFIGQKRERPFLFILE
ncbi:hypothetical protein B4135_4232 [Caldibacillus debilis]|uniref:Uncharacterized protein n=1 Tax=Caldibacillus debilis TaxID=301148 RepID=A0A150L5G3_9BACI|nr:hypothetical protein B4135_4232 [Caldibacillus debilis]